MKYYIKTIDSETFICDTAEQMQQVWNQLGDDVTFVYTSENGVKAVLFDRCW